MVREIVNAPRHMQHELDILLSSIPDKALKEEL